jgi:hypothetical protein
VIILKECFLLKSLFFLLVSDSDILKILDEYLLFFFKKSIKYSNLIFPISLLDLSLKEKSKSPPNLIGSLQTKSSIDM